MEERAKKNLRLLNLLGFLSGFRAFEGVIAVYFATISGSYAAAMTVLATVNFSASFFEIPTGVFSDYIGRKKTLVLFYGAGCLGIFFYWAASSSALLFLGALLTGLSMALRSGTISAYVYENLEILGKGNEFKAYEGHRQSVVRYSMVAAGIVGTPLIFFFDMRAAVLVTLAGVATAFALSFLLRDVRERGSHEANIYAHIGEAWRAFLQDPALRDISIGRIIAQGGGNLEYRFRALLFATIMPPWLVNIVGMMNNLITGISMKLTPRVVERFGIMKSLVHVEIYSRLTTAVCVVANSIPAAFIMNIFTSISFGVREIAAEDVLQSRYTKNQRATMGSLLGLSGSLLYGALGIAAGFLADAIGVVATMLILQPALLLSAVFFYKGIKRLGDISPVHKDFAGSMNEE